MAGSGGSGAPGLEALRARMDEVTMRMVGLLKERTEIAVGIGRAKRSAGLVVADAGREESLRRRVAAECGALGLDAAMGSRLLDLLLDESVRVQSGGAGAPPAAPRREPRPSMFQRAKALEAGGRRIIHMEVGEPDFAPPPEAERALAGACAAGRTRYGPPKGTPELRAAFAEYARRYGASPGAEDVMVTPGGRFSVFLAMSALLSPGDEVVLVEPAWPAYRDCAELAGAAVRAVGTSLEGGWVPRLEDVERAASGPAARMLVLNYPNNPTGRVLPPGTMDGLMSLAAERGLYVLSDEIYSEHAWPSSGWKSALSYGYGRAVTVQSLSKSHAMTGFRAGFAVAAPPITDRMARLQAVCLTSVPDPVQHAALAALGADVSGRTAEIRSRLRALQSRASAMGLRFLAPDGAMYLFATPGNGAGFDGTALANRLLGYGVAVAPGEDFGGYGRYVRISACLGVDELMEGMDAVERALAEGGGVG